jgi:hypothetical protein
VPGELAGLQRLNKTQNSRRLAVTMIRNAISIATAIVALTAIDVRPAAAEVYRPWCVQYFGGISGGTTCAFDSYAQCMETARGNGAYCYQNPWYSQGLGQGGDRPRTRPR